LFFSTATSARARPSSSAASRKRLGLDPDAVSSPTFTIVQEYRGPALTLQHVDLYRLSPREVEDLALEDLLSASTVMAIEWAERLDVMPRGAVVEVRLEHDGDAANRRRRCVEGVERSPG
jgi:tRNA threonylcarbamoyladenosine biosynthesis protein TsaE